MATRLVVGGSDTRGVENGSGCDVGESERKASFQNRQCIKQHALYPITLLSFSQLIPSLYLLDNCAYSDEQLSLDNTLLDLINIRESSQQFSAPDFLDN